MRTVVITEHGSPDVLEVRDRPDPRPGPRSAVREEIVAGVQRANAHLSRVEQIKRYAILPCDWPPAGDELTPTMKLKRKPIAAKYADEIDALYAS